MHRGCLSVSSQASKFIQGETPLVELLLDRKINILIIKNLAFINNKFWRNLYRHPQKAILGSPVFPYYLYI